MDSGPRGVDGLLDSFDSLAPAMFLYHSRGIEDLGSLSRGHVGGRAAQDPGAKFRGCYPNENQKTKKGKSKKKDIYIYTVMKLGRTGSKRNDWQKVKSESA